MNKQLLQSEDKTVIEVLKYLRNHPKKTPKIADWQREFGLGYARAVRLAGTFEAAGIITRGKSNYKMVMGEDGKRHREYLPYRLNVSVEELNEFIEYLNVNRE